MIQLTQRLRDPMRAILEDEDEEDAQDAQTNVNRQSWGIILLLYSQVVGSLWGLDVGGNRVAGALA